MGNLNQWKGKRLYYIGNYGSQIKLLSRLSLCIVQLSERVVERGGGGGPVSASLLEINMGKGELLQQTSKDIH